MSKKSRPTERAAVFFDRDGVLNRAILRGGRPYPPSSIAELEIVPDAVDTLRKLADAGYGLVCVTNQPDVARGLQIRDVVDAINAEVRRRLPLDDFRVCYHDTGDGCDCRKPKPGMLIASALECDLCLAASLMVGDRWSDIEAARRAGCRAVLIGDGYGEPNPWNARPDFRAASLADVAGWILATEQRNQGT